MASTSSSSSSDVILVLCGWAGSQEKHLSIYEELLRRVLSRTVPGVRVASAIRCSLPLRLIFSPVESPRTSWVVENVMEPLRSCAEDLQSSSPTVLVHAFSNGGGFVVEQMVKLYEREELRANPDRIRLPPIGGIIFDSAPGYDGGEMGERVLAEVLGTGAWYQRAGIRVAHASQRLAARLINSNRQKDYWKLMTDIGGGYLVFGIWYCWIAFRPHGTRRTRRTHRTHRTHASINRTMPNPASVQHGRSIVRPRPSVRAHHGKARPRHGRPTSLLGRQRALRTLQAP